MDWVIFNSRGSRIRAFDDEDAAATALVELAGQTDQSLYLVRHDQEGRAIETLSLPDLARDDRAWVRVVDAPDVVSVSGGNREPTAA